MATEWGPVADWVGASVTFLGFVGAIAALKVQRKSVDVQVEQHNKTKQAEEEAERIQEAALAARALEKKEKDARAVKLTVSAGRRKAPLGSEFVHEQPFVVRCSLVFPNSAKYTHVEFKHPDKPDDFRVVEDTARDTNFSTVGRGARIFWEISGDVWPYSSENEAQAWVAERTFVTFVDPAGVKWKLDGAGSLKEDNK
jgi:hypothetical protein